MATTRKQPPRKAAPRADLGAPIDGYLRKQPPHLRAILEALRALIEAVAPDASASIKWGQPFFTIDGAMMCALGGHKAHVSLILVGPVAEFRDPDGRLGGAGKGSRSLKLKTLAELPRAAVRSWLKVSAAYARSHA